MTLRIRVAELLARALGPSRLSGDAVAFVATAGPDRKVLRLAKIDPKARQWKILPTPEPITVNGRDAAAFARDLAAGAPGLARIEMDGRDWIEAYGPIGKFGEQSWGLVVALPYSVVDEVRGRADVAVQTAFSDQLRNATVFAGIALTLAGLAAVFAARSLTRPIKKLHDAAMRLAAGDYTVRVEADGKDEIGDLARGFNRMVPAIEDQVRVKRELDIAREIQQHLLPKAAPSLPGFDIVGQVLFCAETGGDYLDFVPLTVGTGAGMAAVIGDVTGHGVGAALLMTSARATILAAAEAGANGGELMRAVNRQLARDAAGGRSMTMLAVVLKAESRSIDWMSAGHEPALLYDPTTDDFLELAGEGIPLGIDAAWQYTTEKLTLPENAALVCITDGIREARNSADVEFGMDGVRGAVRAARG
ncbi:MAG: SpoIIE family protein phosphatase [Proteobacteria bacterium]|nr:SpoIIE family protein phosphatase [Pseudomonadota bacterium]